MGITLMRSSRSPVLFEAKDFATGIFDRDGRVLDYHQYLPLMAFCLGPAVEDVIRQWGQSVQPDDVFIHNDPYRGGTHAMDVAVVRPVFFRSKLIGWTACKGHMMDWGGPTPTGYNANATTRWEEPMHVPAMHLYRRGTRVQEAFTLIAANIRVPDIVLHDIEAMVGCTVIGAKRLSGIVERFGMTQFSSLADAWIEGTRTKARAYVRDLPDGVYTGESRIQYGGGEWAVIVASVRIKGDQLTVDFEGTSPQTNTYINAPRAVTKGGVLHCLAIMLGSDVHLNAGFVDAFEVRIPPRSILSAEYPAAVSYCLHLTDQISESMFKALAPIASDCVLAGWLQWGTSVSGNWQGNDFATPLFFPSKGGSGATRGDDGYDYIGSIRMAGALESEDVEIFEQSHGWAQVRRVELWADSGGAGQWRGGLGAFAEIVLNGEEMEVAVFGTGRDVGAFGLFGGHESPRSRAVLEYPDGRSEELPAHANIKGVPAGTVLRKWNTGGGGYGRPRHREMVLVERDLIEGYVTSKAAEEVYGR